jgi:cysteine dioxygenase
MRRVAATTTISRHESPLFPPNGALPTFAPVNQEKQDIIHDLLKNLPAAPVTDPAVNSRKGVCYHHPGTGEKVKIVTFETTPQQREDFELAVQEIAAQFYNMQVGVTDVRVMHGKLDVTFILTFVSDCEMERFIEGPLKKATAALSPHVINGAPTQLRGGCLMPQCHTLTSLIKYLRGAIKGSSHRSHMIEEVRNEIAKWYPRPAEYMKYVHWNKADPTKYTRNLIFTNEYFDVVLMAWPPHSQSAIHDHDESSCWVALVDGEVTEVQYKMPKLDRKFQQGEYANPTGAVGRCTALVKTHEETLSNEALGTTYVNNERGIHRVENRTDKPAYTLHVYAPGLRKMRLFQALEGGGAKVAVGCVPPWTSKCGKPINSDYWADPAADVEGIIDTVLWNAAV